ncbi:hypothetical protein EON66_09915 [archaeon]|nr:MAG: hypothetical protein EON66_09915 [archaeon]
MGEDAMLNVWSLPEYLVSGKFKVICDMHAPIPDAVVTGVAFTSAGHKAPSNVIVSVYDSTSLRVFLGL